MSLAILMTTKLILISVTPFNIIMYVPLNVFHFLSFLSSHSYSPKLVSVGGRNSKCIWIVQRQTERGCWVDMIMVTQ